MGMVVTLLICWLDLLVERQVQLQTKLLRASSPSAPSPSSSPANAAAVVAGLRDVAKRRQDVFLLVDSVLRFVTGVSAWAQGGRMGSLVKGEWLGAGLAHRLHCRGE